MIKKIIRCIGRILFAVLVLVGFLLGLAIAVCVTWLFCSGVDWLIEFVRM